MLIFLVLFVCIRLVQPYLQMIKVTLRRKILKKINKIETLKPLVHTPGRVHTLTNVSFLLIRVGCQLTSIVFKILRVATRLTDAACCPTDFHLRQGIKPAMV